MVRFLRPPAGEEYKVQRKMVWFLMWFIVSGIIRDIQFVSAASEMQQLFQKKSNDNHDVQKNSSISTKNSEVSPNDGDSQLESNRKIRSVPPRVKNPKNESDSGEKKIIDFVLKIPIQIIQFHERQVPRRSRPRSFVEDTEHLTLFDIRKKSKDGKKRNTVIPTPRFGRSYNEDLAALGVESSQNTHLLYKRSNTIIPIAIPERGSNKIKRDISASILPYPRLGQFSTGNGDQELAEGEVKPNFMEKYLEFVDAEYDDLDFNNSVQKREEQGESNTVIPYPRPGRSDSENNFYSQIKRENTEYIVPQIRYGRSILLLSTTKNDKSAKEKPHTFILPYPRPGRSNEKNGLKFEPSNVLLPYPNNEHDVKDVSFSNERKRQDYMLPTARLGRSALNTQFEEGNILDIGEAFLGLKVNPLFLKNVSENPKDLSDSGSSFVIPYPRPGKKSTLTMQNSNEVAKSNTDDKNLTEYVLPYPRPGKKFSNKPSIGKYKNNNSGNENSEKQNFILPYPRPGRSYRDWFEKENTQEKYQEIKNEDYEFFEDAYQDADEFLDDSNYSTTSEMDISKQEDSSDGLRFKRSNTVVAYPRLGRSNFVVPYPRFGRSNYVVPYPRFGRSDSIVPYPRPGRSNSVVPYPRPGRSNSVIPYPRLGRSNTVVPYPRLGRSNSVIPYPRLGRSPSIIPYPRPGRSNFYNSVNGEDGSYSIIPSASNSDFPNLRLRKSNYITPYPRPGRSQEDKLFSINNRQKGYLSPKLQERDNTKREDTYIVPYPRPGRFSENKRSENNMVIPYPRPGRSNRNGSGYVLPYPRVGRSEHMAFNDKETPMDGSIIPFPPAERSQQDTPPNPSNSIHKLNKHMIPNADDSIYLLPYPRPGRYSQ